MKLKELKHNHSLTDLLKVIIFAILMLTPFFCVATRCLYVICNKNAYQSYSQYYENKFLPIENLSSLEEGINYNYVYNETLTTTLGAQIGFSEISYDYTTLQGYDSNVTYSYFMTSTSGYLYFYDDTLTTSIITTGWGSTITQLNFTYNGTINSQHRFNGGAGEVIFISLQKGTLDNVFEYSINELENSELINWTKSTMLFNGVSAMTTQLEINGNVIAMLITYWLLIMIIYIILDIVIVLFTHITHLLGSKTT